MRISMAVLSVDLLFDAAIRIQLTERSISLTFSEDTIRIKFPTTRRLAEFLEVPHYYVLPYFAMMEQEELVTRAERVGILTTMKGTNILIGLMKTHYRSEAEKILGPELFNDIVNALSRYKDS
jgi:DNA-binding transcriptional regulator YhcF (GntR family)